MQMNPSWSLANFHRILSEFWLFSHRKRIPIRMQTNFIRIRKNFLLELRHFLRNSFKYRENYVGVESSSRTTAARSMLTFIERFTMLGGIVARHCQPHLWPLPLLHCHRRWHCCQGCDDGTNRPTPLSTLHHWLHYWGRWWQDNKHLQRKRCVAFVGWVWLKFEWRKLDEWCMSLAGWAALTARPMLNNSALFIVSNCINWHGVSQSHFALTWSN